MKVAIAQMRMYWTVVENVRAILSINEQASSRGADMVLFPELAVTGFHREILRECSALLDDEGVLASIEDSCARNNLCIWLGLPYSAEAKLYNSYLCIGPDGQRIGVIHKNGLTESEKMVFAAGSSRPLLAVADHKVSAILCREVADVQLIADQFCDETPDLLVWPGYIGNRSFPIGTLPEGTVDQAAKVSDHLKLPIVQCNWANSLNDPAKDDLGSSVVLNSEGRKLWTCPEALPGVGYVDMDNGECQWVAET